MLRLLSIFVAVAVTLTAADIRPLSGDLRIIGGTPAKIEQYPYQVSIEVNGNHKGGGAILSEKYIITSAKNIPAKNSFTKNISVVVGVTDRSRRDRKVYNSTNWIPFPNVQNKDKDVGIIVLDTPIKFGPGVQPIALVTKQEHPKPGDMLTLTGWGSMVGDGGGPAVTDNKKLAGIISWGDLNALVGNPTVLTDVTSPPVADFIKAVLNGTIKEDVLLEKRRKELAEKKKREEERRKQEEEKKGKTSKP